MVTDAEGQVARLPGVVDLLRLRAPGPAGREGERHATWLELFFDLVFVLALSAVTARLGTDPSPTLSRVAVAVGLYVLVQWAWLTQSFYDTRFDPDDWPHRVLVFVAAAGAGGIALGARNLPGDLMLPAGYVLVRGALILMYLRVFVGNRSERAVAAVYLWGFSVGGALWVASLALPAGSRPVLWTVALGFELATPWWGQRWLRRHPVDPSHLPERLGQFTIILLGAMLANLIDAVPLPRHSDSVIGTAALAYVVPVCIWWVYTTFVTTRLGVARLHTGSRYAVLHAPLGAAILFLGWALGQVVHEFTVGASRLPFALRLVLGGSVAIWTLSGLLLQWLALGSLSRTRVAITVLGMAAMVPITVVAAPLPALVLTVATMVGYAALVTSQIRHVRATHPDL